MPSSSSWLFTPEYPTTAIGRAVYDYKPLLEHIVAISNVVLKAPQPVRHAPPVPAKFRSHHGESGQPIGRVDWPDKHLENRTGRHYSKLYRLAELVKHPELYNELHPDDACTACKNGNYRCIVDRFPLRKHTCRTCSGSSGCTLDLQTRVAQKRKRGQGGGSAGGAGEGEVDEDGHRRRIRQEHDWRSGVSSSIDAATIADRRKSPSLVPVLDPIAETAELDSGMTERMMTLASTAVDYVSFGEEVVREKHSLGQSLVSTPTRPLELNEDPTRLARSPTPIPDSFPHPQLPPTESTIPVGGPSIAQTPQSLDSVPSDLTPVTSVSPPVVIDLAGSMIESTDSAQTVRMSHVAPSLPLIASASSLSPPQISSPPSDSEIFGLLVDIDAKLSTTRPPSARTDRMVWFGVVRTLRFLMDDMPRDAAKQPGNWLKGGHVDNDKLDWIAAAQVWSQTVRSGLEHVLDQATMALVNRIPASGPRQDHSGA